MVLDKMMEYSYFTIFSDMSWVKVCVSIEIKPSYRIGVENLSIPTFKLKFEGVTAIYIRLYSVKGYGCR